MKKISPHTKRGLASLTRNFKYPRYGVGVYFDYAATTPVAPEVFKAMKPYFSAKFGNPSSLHSFGQEAMAAVDESREKIARVISADFREIIFTGSATEANNLALRGVVRACGSYFQKTPSFPQARETQLDPQPRSSDRGRRPCPLGLRDTFSTNFRKPLIIVSAIEHESILETCRDLEKNGVEIIYLPVNRSGFIDLKKLKNSLNERTILVSIMYANNEIGTIQPIAEISQIIRDFREELGIRNKELGGKNPSFIIHNSSFPILHTDAVQAFQFLDCDVNKLGVDLMTLSAHKIYGPKGIGALYARDLRFKIQDLRSENKLFINHKSYFLNPIITGGGQEFGLRSGTENVPAIVGFAKAIELTVKNREKETKIIAGLADYFWKEIKKICPKAEINGSESKDLRFMIYDLRRLPNILNIYFPNQSAQDLLMKLDLNGIAVSSGAACSSRSLKPSYVLETIGLSEKRAKSSLRFSFGKFTTKGEINNAIKIIRKII